MPKRTLTALLGLAGFIAASSIAIGAVNSETKQAAQQTGAASVSEIKFDKGSAVMSAAAKKELAAIITNAQKKGTLKEVQVAVWADQEYPQKGTEVAQPQVDLASKRAENVESYLKDQFKVSSVKTLNMAERPNVVQDTVNTPSAKTKDALENTGAAPTASNQTGLFGLKGKASHAVVMIYYK